MRHNMVVSNVNFYKHFKDQIVYMFGKREVSYFYVSKTSSSLTTSYFKKATRYEVEEIILNSKVSVFCPSHNSQ